MKCVNLGCGNRYHPDWINIDVVPQGPGVIAHDLSTGIPLEDDSCDVVYHSAVLEHIRRADAPKFLSECRRVLKPGGIIRVGVPDLEQICRLYLKSLEGALAGEAEAAHNYDWILLEMYDQTVREQVGGRMFEYLRRPAIPNEAFVIERIGDEGKQMIEGLRRSLQPSKEASPASPPPNVVRAAVKRLVSPAREVLRRIKNLATCPPDFAKERLSPADRRALEIGRMRLSGELHQWMYDRYSLPRLLLQTGFCSPVQQNAGTSMIPGWVDFHLDALPDGLLCKPDSFFFEAVKPER